MLAFTTEVNPDAPGATVAEELPIQLAAWPFWVAVPPVILQLVLAAKPWLLSWLDPFVINLVPLVQRL